MMKRFVTACVVMAVFACAAAAYSGEKNTLSADVFSEITTEFILKQAATDLQKNKYVYLQMHKQVDGANGLAWMKILGDAMPSQPVAVLEIMSLSKVNVESICPVFFPEETDDSVIDAWNASAIDALKSFTMVNQEQENIRRQCLKNILATSQKK